jgi:hypothetical protein
MKGTGTMNNDFAEQPLPTSANGSHAIKKKPPSAISNHLREELIRILSAGDDKHDGAFTIAIATQVEKFVVAARDILMTENLAQNDLGSLMRMRKQAVGPWGGVTLGGGSYVGDDGFGIPSVSPLLNTENFGVQAVRQLVESVRTLGDSPAKLVEALATAREHNLTDVVASLEKKLGISKPEALEGAAIGSEGSEGAAS